MKISGILYVEKNNPICKRAILICRYLEKMGILRYKVLDITTRRKIYSKARNLSIRLPLLYLRNIGIFHFNSLRNCFEDWLKMK